MKKIIALILTLVLILSMSISVFAANIPASARFYVYLEDFSYNLDEFIIWIQPEECTDDVLPEGKPSDLAFYDYIMNNWTGCRPGDYEYETKENLYSIFLPALSEGNFLEQNVTGNFIVMVQYTDPSIEEEQYYVTDLLNFFNEEKQNTVVIDFGDAEPTCRYEKTGHVPADDSNDQCLVFGTRGEAITTGDVISVDLSWGGMEFVYTAEQTVWNPNTHEYEEVLNADGSSPSGWSVKEGSSNHIAITNHSNVPVKAALTFTSAEGKNIFGSFGNSSLYCPSAEETYNSPEKAPAATTEFNIIRSKINEETAGDLGTITITISKHVEQ